MVRARACEQLSPAGMQHELRSVREQFTFTVCSYQCKYEYQTTNSLTMHSAMRVFIDRHVRKPMLALIV
jgi:hypothetical protein